MMNQLWRDLTCLLCNQWAFTHLMKFVSEFFNVCVLWKIKTRVKEKKVVFEARFLTPEPVGCFLPFITEPCWLAPCHGCLFLQGTRVILASSLASSNLTSLLVQCSKPGCNPCMPCCSPCASRLTLLHESFHILTMKNTFEFFTKGLLERALVVENLAEPRGGTWSAQASHGFEEWGWHRSWQGLLFQQLGLWHWADSSCRIHSGKGSEDGSQVTSHPNQRFWRWK